MKVSGGDGVKGIIGNEGVKEMLSQGTRESCTQMLSLSKATILHGIESKTVGQDQNIPCTRENDDRENNRESNPFRKREVSVETTGWRQGKEIGDLEEFIWNRTYQALQNWFISVVVVQSPSHVRLCDPMDCSTPGLPVPPHLLEFGQVHVHCISDAVQLSHPLMPSSPSAHNLSQHQGLFQ